MVTATTPRAIHVKTTFIRRGMSRVKIWLNVKKHLLKKQPIANFYFCMSSAGHLTFWKLKGYIRGTGKGNNYLRHCQIIGYFGFHRKPRPEESSRRKHKNAGPHRGNRRKTRVPQQ